MLPNSSHKNLIQEAKVQTLWSWTKLFSNLAVENERVLAKWKKKMEEQGASTFGLNQKQISNLGLKEKCK